MGMSDYKLWLHSKGTKTGTALGQSGSEYTEDEIDTGILQPNLGAGGPEVGLHLVIQESYNTLTSVELAIVHGAATAPTTKLVSRWFVLAQLTAGKHYFLAIPPTVLEFLRAYFIVTGSNPTTGKVSAWIGPKVGREE